MLRAGETDIVHAEEPESKLAVASQLKLGLAKSYYTMAQALGLQKLQDLVLVSDSVKCIKSRCCCLKRHVLHAGRTFFVNFK